MKRSNFCPHGTSGTTLDGHCRMQIRGILLIAWAQWPQSVSTADALTTCAERRTHLASALDVITRLEAELEEARGWMSEKALEVMRCELNTTTLQSSGEPPQESARTFRCHAPFRQWASVDAYPLPTQHSTAT